MRGHRRFVALAAFALAFGTGAATFATAAHAASCVPMTQGQADINSHPAGTRFCLSGTHNWTLTPKTNDTITGGILDGNHTTADAVIAASGVSGVSLSNIEIRNYLTEGDAFGAIHIPDPPTSHDWFLANLYVHDNGNGDLGAGSELGTGWIVIGGRYSYNRQEGLTAGNGASNDIVTSYGKSIVELDHNSNPNICSHEGGGFKWVADNITVQYANVHDNACMGLWADIGSTGGVIRHNTVKNNANNGIFWEISNSASITNNTVTGNGLHIAAGACTSYPFGGGISVIDSPGPVTVSGNTLSGNCHGVVLDDGDSTGDGCGGCTEVANVHVSGNSTSSTGSSGYFEEDGDGPGEGQAQGNSFANNTGTGWCNFAC